MFSAFLSTSILALSAAGAAPEPTAVPATGAALASADTIVVRGEYFSRDISSAMKTPTPLIDIPQSLTVVTERQIDEQAFLSIADISRFIPGIAIGQGEGHRDQITIRGQNTTADFFIDGLRDDVQYFRPLYNIESVEVLRGANAMIFGRGGGGGVINRTTKTPDAARQFVSTTSSVDTFGSLYQDVDLNTAVGDRSAFRLNAFAEHLENHRDVFEGDRFAVNPTFSTGIGDRTDLLLSYEYVDDERVVDRGVPSVGGAPLEGFEETFFGDPDLNETTLSAHIARARVDHRLTDSVELNTTVQYAVYDKLYQNIFPVGFDPAAGEVGLDGYRDTTDRENFIVQSNLVARLDTGPLSHTLLGGFEYASQHTDNARDDAVFEATGDSRITTAFSDPLVVPAVAFSNLVRDRSSDLEVLSFYLQDQVDIGPYVKVVGGVRYDRFDLGVDDFLEIADGAGDGNDGFLGRVDEEISPRLGVILKPLANLSVYGSYSKSFLPRSGDQFLSLSVSDETLEPEEFENHEAGIKWDLTPGLSLTAAVFRLDRESGTTVDPANPENSIIIGSRTEGVEIQLVGALTDWWQLTGGYSYLDAEERGRVVGDELANRRLAQVPEHMFSVWNRFEVTERLGASLGVTHQAEQFATISNAVTLPAFTRVDVSVDYALTDRFALQVNVENLFDKDFFTDAHNDNNISTAEPLNARFTLSTRF